MKTGYGGIAVERDTKYPFDEWMVKLQDMHEKWLQNPGTRGQPYVELEQDVDFHCRPESLRHAFYRWNRSFEDPYPVTVRMVAEDGLVTSIRIYWV